MTCLRLAVVVLTLAAISASAQSQDPSDYDRVLVPVFFNSRGAFGSFWTTDVTATNLSGNPIVVARPLFGVYVPSCLPGCSCSPRNDIGAYGASSMCDEVASRSGVIVYVPKGVTPDDLQWDGHIRDLSRQADSAGTQIPIVRESELRVSHMSLPHIASGPNFRSALRVYSYDAGTEVGIAIYDERAGMLVRDQLKLTSDQTAGPFPMHPQFAMIGDLAAAYPELASATHLRIEIVIPQPLADPPHFNHAWAFVSTTNNTTQQVTITSPQ
jgi:hypothetical protein